MLLDGVRVDRFPEAESKLRRLDGLLEALARRHPNEPQDDLIFTDHGPYTLRLPRDVDVATARSILLTASYAGYSRATIEGFGQPRPFHMPIFQRPDDTPPTTREWLAVLVAPEPTRLQWIRKAPNPKPFEVVREKELALNRLAEEARLTVASWGAAAPCDDVVFRSYPAERFERVLSVVSALDAVRDCPRQPWIGLALVQPDAKAQPLYPRPARDATLGRLAPARIQKVVRERYGVFRNCYEAGLARSANLQGRVVVRFVIRRDGTVEAPELIESTLPDPEAVSCIVEGYRELQFPEPKGGVITVVYPIMFAPG